MVQCLSLFSQEGNNVPDSISIPQDSLRTDTLFMTSRNTSSNAIDQEVTYSAVAYIKRDIINKKMFLVGAALVTYGEMEIRADSIVFDMRTDLLFATGRKDTTGTIVGKPAFKKGEQEFEADELTYNFKTEKAIIKNNEMMGLSAK